MEICTVVAPTSTLATADLAKVLRGDIVIEGFTVSLTDKVIIAIY